MIARSSLARFSKSDWYGFAGAERFDDGTEPYIGSVTVDGADACLVWDAHGMQIFWCLPDTHPDCDADGLGGNDYYAIFDGSVVNPPALLEILDPDMTTETLLGFVRVCGDLAASRFPILNDEKRFPMKQALVKAALFTPITGERWGLPLLCWGEPGVAKTSVIEEICARYELPCETLSPSERGEGAFGVVPVPLERDGETLLCYPAPEWTQQFIKSKRGVVFVDEATSTPPALQAPLMGLILARRIGGMVLPKGVRVLAAANPSDIAAGGFDLAAPVANRFGHIDWTKPTVEEHVQYMLRGSNGTKADVESDNAAEEEKRVMKLWPTAWSRAVGLETAFLSRRSELKNQCPKAGDPKASRAWPSDRSWEMATRAWAAGEVHGLTEMEQEVFVAAFIGEGAANEFFVWAKEQDLPDPAELLDGKAKFQHSSKRLDRTVAVLASCTALVVPRAAPQRAARAAAFWAMLDQLCSNKTDLDVMVPAVQALTDADLHAMKEATETFRKVLPLLRLADVQRPGRR